MKFGILESNLTNSGLMVELTGVFALIFNERDSRPYKSYPERANVGTTELIFGSVKGDDFNGDSYKFTFFEEGLEP